MNDCGMIATITVDTISFFSTQKWVVYYIVIFKLRNSHYDATILRYPQSQYQQLHTVHNEIQLAIMYCQKNLKIFYRHNFIDKVPSAIVLTSHDDARIAGLCVNTTKLCQRNESFQNYVIFVSFQGASLTMFQSRLNFHVFGSSIKFSFGSIFTVLRKFDGQLSIDGRK